MIQASPESGTAPLDVNLSGLTSSDPGGSIASYLWDLGDSTSATTATVAKTYTVPGVYHVTLTVTDNKGATNTAAKDIAVGAPNVSPTAMAGADPGSGKAPLLRGQSVELRTTGRFVNELLLRPPI